ncbi:MAG: hypothetical protein KDI74_14120 [Gammaproteobacteria bacterium]|nr:hypothetical protein [Gammaproteobacteria bacterium]HXK57092.1 hypothetical protein [Gammaproteobacteria bacterium]
MSDLDRLKHLVLAPYVLKATALTSVSRRVGGNQFRHGFSTLGILLDYKYYNDSVLLKASLIHDLLEDLPDTQIDEIRRADFEGNQVVDLVLEVTRRREETKAQYLQRVLETGSVRAKTLKCADRISNLTDLHRDTHPNHKITDYLIQTEQFILPMAREVNADMVIELTDLITKRREILDVWGWPRRYALKLRLFRNQRGRC